MIYDNIWFINKATDIHGDKYDYSLVNYVNSKTKIKIICSIHGEFEQTPDKHIYRKQGCPHCGGTKKLTIDEFIIKAKSVHSDKYDYSLVNYCDSHNKVKIICPIHGKFEQISYVHLNGNGCPECGYNRNNFIDKAKLKYGNKYDYSLVDYKNTFTKVKIICPIHGEFQQFPQPHLKYGCTLCNREKRFIQNAKLIHNDKYDYSLVKYIDEYTNIKIFCPKHGEFDQMPKYHIRGNGCKKCSDDIKRLDTDEFIMRAKKSHGNKYDYSLVKYVGAFDKVKIICPIHGEFEQKATEHINNNRGCPKCGGTMKSNTNDFILKAKKIHRSKYDYSLVNYIDVSIKVEIICKKHGTFYQSPTNHLSGKGCPICNNSKGENEILIFLKNKNIKYIYQKKFNDCKNKKCLPFDFYIPDYNLCIEYDGIQHFKPNSHFGGISGFKKTQINDNIKNKYCSDNNINLLRIKYNENVVDKLKNNIK